MGCDFAFPWPLRVGASHREVTPPGEDYPFTPGLKLNVTSCHLPLSTTVLFPMGLVDLKNLPWTSFFLQHILWNFIDCLKN